MLLSSKAHNIESVPEKSLSIIGIPCTSTSSIIEIKLDSFALAKLLRASYSQ